MNGKDRQVEERDDGEFDTYDVDQIDLVLSGGDGEQFGVLHRMGGNDRLWESRLSAPMSVLAYLTAPPASTVGAPPTLLSQRPYMSSSLGCGLCGARETVSTLSSMGLNLCMVTVPIGLVLGEASIDQGRRTSAWPLLA